MYGGCVVSCTVPQRATATIEPAPSLVVRYRNETVEFVRPEDLSNRGDAFDAVRAALGICGIEPGRDPFALTLSTDIPVQSGLAGSTAILTAAIGAIQAVSGGLEHPHRLIETSRQAERDLLGVACGYQDAALCVMGGLRYVDLRGRESLRQGPDEPYLTAEPLAAPSMPFLLAHSGVQHHSGSVHKTLRQRWEEGEQQVIEAYRRVTRLGMMGKRALLDGDWNRLASLMTENHVIQRDLGGSGPSNEALIAAALSGGALAAKLAGAGGGGTIIALTLEPERTAAALRKAGAERILDLDPNAPGLTIRSTSPNQ